MRPNISNREKLAKGITLIELLLVISLMALVGMAVYGSFSLGLTVYKRAETNKPRNEAIIFSERVADDLRNLVDFPEHKFSGNADRMTFHVHGARSLISDTEGEISKESPVLRVEYKYEISRGRVVRRAYKYGQTEPYSSVTVLNANGTVHFSYLKKEQFPAKGSDFSEKSDNVPRAVKITVADGNQKGAVFSRIFNVPISGM